LLQSEWDVDDIHSRWTSASVSNNNIRWSKIRFNDCHFWSCARQIVQPLQGKSAHTTAILTGIGWTVTDQTLKSSPHAVNARCENESQLHLMLMVMRMSPIHPIQWLDLVTNLKSFRAKLSGSNSVSAWLPTNNGTIE
jgi:hypothetical protein